MPYRDAVVRVSIGQVRSRFRPVDYRKLQSVRLEHAGVACDVGLVIGDGWGVVARRRWMICPRCDGRVKVLGVVAGVGWACATCAGWRSRNRKVRAPVVSTETASD